MGVIGKDIRHDSAATHVTGRSVFLEDVPPIAHQLIAGFVPSPVARGVVRRIDVTSARSVSGVTAIVTAEDLPGHNAFGPVVLDEELIATNEVVFIGQPLCLIAAESAAALDAARRAVVVEIDELPPVLTIDDAFARNSFLGQPRHLHKGDVVAGLAAAPRRLQGTLRIGGQEHFYLENQVAIAIPGEQGCMTIHSSTQHTTEVQSMVAEALGVHFNQVTCICLRMGGGFGGKETQAAPPAIMAAVLAAKTNRPVRFAYSKDDDMRFTGKRHPFKAVYDVGFDDSGRVLALDLKLFADGGCSTDLSFAVLERAMLHSDNAYYIPHVRIEGRVCKTNLPSNTAFRGFGGPQGVAAKECVLEEIAQTLGLDPLDVRKENLYRVGERDTTHYGQIVRNNTLHELHDELRSESAYDARRREIEQFNATSRTHLRGMALSFVKFGISFTRRTLNQANALVNIYQDGSVLVSTGATEMGQGVHTRVRQIVADELGQRWEKVRVTATNTDKNNNTSPTAASSGTDLNGAAAAVACRLLRTRLAGVAADMLAKSEDGLAPEPEHVRFADGKVYDDRVPAKSIYFSEVVCRAYLLRVNLGERGFYATPGVDFNRETGRGTPFLYYTNGAACSEVLIDRFTGQLSVERVDLIMDVGKPLNPGIDRGQVIGGFVQGLGWATTEELMYDQSGTLLSYSPTTYKIPAISDVPKIFNVRFLDNPDNDVSLYRSKAVGEPPLLLGLSVWLAAKNALSYLRPGVATLDLPATGERVLMTSTFAKR